jgi:LacI family transcriptional regulator
MSMIRIGIDVDMIGSYGREVLRGLIQFSGLENNWEFVRPTMYGVERKTQLRPRLIDGAVIMVHSLQSIRHLQRSKVPIVNVSHTLDAHVLNAHRLYSVIPDDSAIGAAAFTYLRERGFRSFAFCGHPTVGWSRHRQTAFVSAASEQGLNCMTHLKPDAVSASWVARLPKPVAIFCANDRYGWLAIDACRSMKIRVPEEVVILGVDNDLLLVDLVKPTLSSIESAGFQVGLAAGALLQQLLKKKRPAKFVTTVPTQSIITRHSTEVLAVEDDDVANALRFIREKSSKPIGVDEVVGYVMVSRRNLERKFKNVLGRSILQEIRRVRIDRACTLLRDTSFDMPSIASGCGFASHVRFGTVFRQVMGMAPSTFRRQHRGELRINASAGHS